LFAVISLKIVFNLLISIMGIKKSSYK